VQVSRWDRLKDPSGVLAGFARLDETKARGAHLVLAGPSCVADDPEGGSVLAEVRAQWLALPDHVRARVHLASIPTVDVDENGAIVNALQRHATIVVQKSLQEGFGLTVTEAMWKAKPVVASAVGGIQDQIQNGVDGLLIANPTDLDEFAAALAHVFHDPAEAVRMGERAHARVIERYLGLDSILRFGALLESIDGQRGNLRPDEAPDRSRHRGM
jgi:trehalose synthase